MSVRTEDLFPRGGEGKSGARFLRSPFVRMAICVLFLGAYLLPHNILIAEFIASSEGGIRRILTWADSILSVGVLLVLYRLFTHWVEGRSAREVGLQGAGREFGLGFLISVGIVGLLVLVLAFAGWYRIQGFGAPSTLADAFFYFGIGAFLQVMVFRLILFRFSEEVFGTWAAMALVAAIFGLAHMGNENATPWTTLAVVLGDVLLAAAFIYTHRLWMVWGLHMGWNFTQDGLFGMPNSGISELPSWIDPLMNGPAWISGGDFGIEASPLQLLLSVSIGGILLRRAWVAGQIVTSSWRR